MNSEKKPKLAFFVKPGVDNFIKDIVEALSGFYAVEIIYITTNLKDIDVHMKAADLCWFEWCDELVIYGSNLALAKHKRIICRVHSYEVFTNYMRRVNWKTVDKVVFVAEHIRDYAVDQIPTLIKHQTIVIPNGIKINELPFLERTKGFNIAHVGYINFKKGPMLLLHAFQAIHKMDSRYKLFIAGTFQEPRYSLYYKQMIKELGLQDHVLFEGWQTDINKWLEDKQYILSSSVLESQHLSVMEAMAKGIKPLVHNFVGAKTIYPAENIWSSIDELVKMIAQEEYNSMTYRKFIEDNFAFTDQLTKIIDLIENELAQIDVYSVYYNGKQTKFYLPNQSDHIQSILVHYQRFYEEKMLIDIESRVLEDSVIIDVGAYIGNHTVFFAEHCNSKVFSIEPNVLAFNLLKENIKLNKLENRTTLLNMGMGKELGKGSIENFSLNNMGMSQLKNNPEGEIVVDTIDHLFVNLQKIDIIKIDVEGMELDVLQGAELTVNKHKPLLYIETATEENLIQISNYLKEFGYNAVKQFNATPTTLFIHPKKHQTK